MIKVTKDYYIDADELCYTVKLNKHKTYTDKNGVKRDVFEIKGYYSTLEGALDGIRRQLIFNSIKDKEVDLDQAIETIRKVDADFKKSFRSAMGDI